MLENQQEKQGDVEGEPFKGKWMLCTIMSPFPFEIISCHIPQLLLFLNSIGPLLNGNG